ncbi:MAG TPA: cupin domain-containing protein [Puia sp.]|nr:cupin domain-containing protein [Puia sp.]
MPSEVPRKKNALYWIEKLNLQPHIEGGHYREIYRSSCIISQSSLPAAFSGDRHIATSIYFLLEAGRYSSFHKILSDETWHFYAGDCLLIYEITEEGSLNTHRLGKDPEKMEHFQVIIPAGHWFAARPDHGTDYALVGCTVSPGFNFSDFELAKGDELTKRFPAHRELILELSSE